MNLEFDLVVAPDWESALNTLEHRTRFPCEQNVGLTMENWVRLLSILRDDAEDRERRARDDLNLGYHFHEREPKTRKVFIFGELGLDEIARADEAKFPRLLAEWSTATGIEPTQLKTALDGLLRLFEVAKRSNQTLFLKTMNADNAFQTAFQNLEEQDRSNYGDAYEQWSESQKLDAHLKYQRFAELEIPPREALSLIQNDIDEDGTWAADYAFMGAVRDSLGRISLSELGHAHLDDADDGAALSRFKQLFTEDEKQAIVRDIAFEVCERIFSCLEEGNQPPFFWRMVKMNYDPANENLDLGPVMAQSLTDYLDDSEFLDWFLPSNRAK